MKHQKRFLSLVLVGVAVTTAPASAQMAVIDPANLAQNVLQAAHALEQIHNQIQQIEQQAKMLARNPLQLSPELSEKIGAARKLFQEAKGIAFEMDRVSDDLRNLYPEDWKEFDLADIGPRTDQWLAEDRNSLEVAMRAQAQAATGIEQSQQEIDIALNASVDAEGQTSALQAGNQLLGINATQLAQIHALLIAQGRALTTEKLEQVARAQRAQEIQRKAFPNERGGDVAPARMAF